MKNVILFLWTIFIIIGFSLLFNYANTPGMASEKLDWPNSTNLEKDPSMSTLVIFLHSQCPCSKATVAELKTMLPILKGKVKTLVAFYKPKGEDSSWVTESDLWTSLRDEDVTLVIDDGGKESETFNSKTSGQTFLFNKLGQSVFEGGITPARGHIGENKGKNTILNFVSKQEQSPTYKVSSVFGCSLKNPERATK